MKNAFRVFAAVMLLSLAGCLALPQPEQQAVGYLKGHISIGPLCPVEANPSDPNCEPTQQTYGAYPLSVYSVANNRLIAQVKGDENGNYEIMLPAGEYEIRSETGMQKVSVRTTINPNGITQLNVDIDTGIR